jgi:hypothetical protein
MKRNKQEIFTVRADAALVDAMKGIPNRSEFVRQAILAALDNVCPICKGTGILTPNQKLHWEDLQKDHTFIECEKCHEHRLTCTNREAEAVS